jgi:hypothetical protein
MPKPAPQIELSRDERRELSHRAACYTRPFREVQRAKLILAAAEGLNNKQIAARLELHDEVVGRWRRRFHEERLQGLDDKARSGRPRRFPPGAGRRGHRDRLRAARQRGRPALTLLSH